ncbi:hypothetical protein [uncultured Nostoc sp.]
MPRPSVGGTIPLSSIQKTLVTLDDSLTLRYRLWRLPLGEDSL